MPRVNKRDNAPDENKKVLAVDQENFSDDVDDELNEDENGGASAGNATGELEIEDRSLEINHWFNELPVRILNAHQFPFFYAEDVAKILGFRSVRKGLANFNEKEIVTQDLRKKYNIITYCNYKGGFRRNDKAILLTEFGVYRLIMNSRGQLADQFRDFIYTVLYQLRTAGEYKIKGELEKLKITNETLLAENGELKHALDLKDKKIGQFKNLCDELVLVEFPNNPYEIEPTNIPARLLKKSVKVRLNAAKNRIDDPVPHAYRVATEVGARFGSDEVITDFDRMRAEHENNAAAARAFIAANTPASAYMVSTEITPEAITDGRVAHRVYVRNKDAALRALGARLADCKSDRVSSRAHWYSCDREKIINCMNAVAG